MPYNMAASCLWVWVCGCVGVRADPTDAGEALTQEAGLNHVSWMCWDSLGIESGAGEACSAQISLQCRFSGQCTMRCGLLPVCSQGIYIQPQELRGIRGSHNSKASHKSTMSNVRGGCTS